MKSRPGEQGFCKSDVVVVVVDLMKGAFNSSTDEAISVMDTVSEPVVVISKATLEAIDGDEHAHYKRYKEYKQQRASDDGLALRVRALIANSRTLFIISNNTTID